MSSTESEGRDPLQGRDGRDGRDGHDGKDGMLDHVKLERIHMLLEATNRLSENVVTLTERLDTSRKVARRTRMLSIIVATLVLVFGATGWAQWSRATDAIEANDANAVRSCQNANQSRAANLELWSYILGAAAKDPSKTPAQRAQIAALSTWVAVLYAPHDCHDLNREYPIPPAPTGPH